MKRVMGIDSGGSKTLLALADTAGRLRWLNTGSTLDPLADKQWPKTLSAMLPAKQQLAEHLSYAVLGLPRYGENVRQSRRQAQAISALLPCPTTLENDVRIAFDGALPGMAGVLILAGTGSMAWASHHQPDSEHIRVGGWGEDIGDEGSAYWIGNQAIIATCRHLDGRQAAPALTLYLCQHFAIKPERLIEYYFALGRTRRQRVASLAQGVAQLAEQGDQPAQHILRQAAHHLAEHLTTAWRRIGGRGPLTWSYAGGVFNSRLLRQYLVEIIKNSATAPRLPPIGGALLRAAQQAGWQPDATWINQLAEDLQQQLGSVQQ